MKIKIIFFILLLIAHCSLLIAADFGIVINNSAGYGIVTDPDGSFEYTGQLVPRFSALIGENGSFFMSAGLTLDYNSVDSPVRDKMVFIPELLRTEIFNKFGNTELSIGRIGYTDPLGFVASGIFDGARVTHASQKTGRLGFGAFYTGLQYKKTANITMTEEDMLNYYSEFKFDDFADSYFAPKRFLAAVDWEQPAIAQRLRLRASVIGQFDLTDNSTTINSQYLILKAGISAGSLLFEAGGSLSAMQIEALESDSKIAMAGDFGIHWTPQASFNNKLSLTTRITSGVQEDSDSIGAFIPVTTKYYGEIFQAKMSSLSILGLAYSARFSEPLGFNISALYFMRHDLITPNQSTIISEGENEKLLGAEIFARFIWSPVSDIQFVFGGGAFIPSLGDVWPDEDAIWKMGLSMVISL